MIEFDGFVTENTVKQVVGILENRQLADEMAEHNYLLAQRHYSFTMLERRLNTLLMECFGEE